MSFPIINNFEIHSNFNKSCLKYRNIYPDFAPTINNLSVTTSPAGVYTVVYISGSNYFPPCNGTTYVQFGSYSNIPIIYFSAFYISFVVPQNAVAGVYTVKVINLYDGNFSTPVNQSYPSIPNYSNPVTYTIT
jgi:hypothetical protein